jgi:hypothetical protein
MTMVTATHAGTLEGLKYMAAEARKMKLVELQILPRKSKDNLGRQSRKREWTTTVFFSLWSDTATVLFNNGMKLIIIVIRDEWENLPYCKSENIN